MNFENRINRLREVLKRRNLDALLITNEANVSYLSGFRGADSMVFLTPREDFFITDFRYLKEAEESLKGFKIELAGESNYKAIEKLAQSQKLKNFGFESMNLPYGVTTQLKSLLKGSRLVPVKDAVEQLRATKDRHEIALIRKSISMTKSIYENISKHFKSRITEERISIRISKAIIERGASPAFSPIVAVDANSSRPHAIPEDGRIKRTCVLLVDFGVKLRGYCTDLTRTMLLGRIPAKVKEIYEIVKTAQEKAISRISSGVRISEVDLAARRYIQHKGYGRFFGHATGHGIGMEVHEYPPIAKNNHQRLREGMVFTVEPAIYIPGLCGVRVEDMVLVKAGGCEILTRGIG